MTRLILDGSCSRIAVEKFACIPGSLRSARPTSMNAERGRCRAPAAQLTKYRQNKIFFGFEAQISSERGADVPVPKRSFANSRLPPTMGHQIFVSIIFFRHWSAHQSDRPRVNPRGGLRRCRSAQALRAPKPCERQSLALEQIQFGFGY